MIEFRLRVDSRITRAVYPLIIECFSELGKQPCPDFPLVEERDEELIRSWKQSMRDDFIRDRQSLGRLLSNPRFAHGYVEIENEDAELILRALAEARLYLRSHRLESFTDEELERADFSLKNKMPNEQSSYLAYLVLAEIQERLICEIS